MPVYEYKCEECGKKFEVLRSMKDADVEIICKSCNSNQTKRMLSTCYAHGTGSKSSTGSGCGGCSGGSCASCGH